MYLYLVAAVAEAVVVVVVVVVVAATAVTCNRRRSTNSSSSTCTDTSTSKILGIVAVPLLARVPVLQYLPSREQGPCVRKQDVDATMKVTRKDAIRHHRHGACENAAEVVLAEGYCYVIKAV